MGNDLENLKDYKTAKDSVDDFRQIQIILDVAIKGLSKFRHYKPIRWMLSELKVHDDVIKSYVNKFESILGEKNEKRLKNEIDK